MLGGAAAALGGAALFRPSDRGGTHNGYFLALQDALDRSGLSGPTLVVDRALLADNIQTLKGHVADRFDYRIVAKSLPSLPLLQEVMALSGSRRLMLFHQPFINEVARALPDADILQVEGFAEEFLVDQFLFTVGGGGFNKVFQI